MTSPVVWVYDDQARGLALLRGARTPALLDVAGLTKAARWSVSGHGWVISRDHLPDLTAQAEVAGVPLRFKEVAR